MRGGCLIFLIVCDFFVKATVPFFGSRDEKGEKWMFSNYVNLDLEVGLSSFDKSDVISLEDSLKIEIDNGVLLNFEINSFYGMYLNHIIVFRTPRMRTDVSYGVGFSRSQFIQFSPGLSFDLFLGMLKLKSKSYIGLELGFKELFDKEGYGKGDISRQQYFSENGTESSLYRSKIMSIFTSGLGVKKRANNFELSFLIGGNWSYFYSSRFHFSPLGTIGFIYWFGI